MKMNKTELEKICEEKAKKHFEEDLRDLIGCIMNNPIGELLRIMIGDKAIPLVMLGDDYGLINSKGIENKFAKHTNLQDAKKGLLIHYKEEEMDKILKSIEDIDYLFNNREEFLALIEDRDHWKNLYKKVSDKKDRLEEKIWDLKNSI